MWELYNIIRSNEYIGFDRSALDERNLPTLFSFVIEVSLSSIAPNVANARFVLSELWVFEVRKLSVFISPIYSSEKV